MALALDVVWPVRICAFSTVATYVLSVLTANVSQVDRVWTFLPTIYTACYALAAPVASPRANLMLVLVTTWMLRLSYNTYRRGLFSLTDEDYRWAVLRKQLHPALFQLVNISFIAVIQNIILFLLGLPTRAAARDPSPLALSDYALASLTLAVLALEFTADNQQYAFHAYKAAHAGGPAYSPAAQWPGARLAWTPADAKRGFVTKGLWAYSRHPNFACEQSFWWLITLLPLLAPSAAFVPALTKLPFRTDALPDLLRTLAPLAPAAVLSALFLSSTLYTEAITAGKYPAYKLYQQRVGMFSPANTAQRGAFLRALGRAAAVEEALWGSGEYKEE